MKKLDFKKSMRSTGSSSATRWVCVSAKKPDESDKEEMQKLHRNSRVLLTKWGLIFRRDKEFDLEVLFRGM